VIVYKWRIVLGGLAAASFLGTFAAGPALASTASPDRVPVVVRAAALPDAAQLIPGAVSAVTALPALSVVTQPVSSVLSKLNRATAPAAWVPSTPNPTGVVPAVGAAAGALLNGIGNVVGNLSGSLLPAVGPAVGGLTAPVDGIAQDLGNLAGLPAVGALLGSVPALPVAGALLSDLSNLVNGTGARVGG
jgi:hypothetical protein